MMLVNKILDAVETRIRKKISDDTVYRNNMPKEFKRPSFFIGSAGCVYTPDIGGMLDVVRKIELTAFAAVDEYYNSGSEWMNEREVQIISAFSEGVIEADGRALHIGEIEVKPFADSRQFIFTLTYKDEALSEKTELPLIENVSVRMENRLWR